MILLDGKALSQKILADLKTQIAPLPIRPILDIILVGNDPASVSYTQVKQKRAKEIGIGGQIHHLADTATTIEIINLITQINQNPEVTALMVQLPLPSSINTSAVLNSVDPRKDADGLTATNLGLLFQNHPSAIASATALGVIKLLNHYQIDLNGKNAVIIGRSPYIGLPLSALLLSFNSTVTICHSHTQNLSAIASQADILVSSVGKPNLITPEFVKPNSAVIDIGYPQGDVDFTAVSPKVDFITPVPGGIGPMTIASLLSNTYQLFIRE